MKIRNFALSLLLASPLAAHSTVLEYTLNTVYEGTAPSGYLTVSFDDGGASGSVIMTLDAANLGQNEKVSSIYFNIDPNWGVADVNSHQNFLNVPNYWGSYGYWSDEDKSNPNDGTALSAGTDSGYFDYKLNTGFWGMESGYFFQRIYEAPDLTAESFIATSFGGQGQFSPFHVSAFISGIGDLQRDTAWVTDGGMMVYSDRTERHSVPEPSSIALLGGGLLFAMMGAGKRAFVSRRSTPRHGSNERA